LIPHDVPRAAATAEDIANKAAERHAQSIAGVCQELFCSPESKFLSAPFYVPLHHFFKRSEPFNTRLVKKV
jgi:hypothetical protein